MKKPWSKGTVTRIRGVHCVRLDHHTHEIAKNLADRYCMTIKDIIQKALCENDWN